MGPRDAATMLLRADVWRGVYTKVKCSIGTSIQIIRKNGPAVLFFGTDPRDETSRTCEPCVTAQAPSSSETDCEFQASEMCARGRSQHTVAVDSPFDDYSEVIESAGEDLRVHNDEAIHGDEDRRLSPASDKQQRLGNRKRRNIPSYVAAVAVVIVSIPAVPFSMWLGGSIGSPADHRADKAAFAKTSPADVKSASMSRPYISAAGADEGDSRALAELTNTRQQQAAQGVQPAPVIRGHLSAERAKTSSVWFQNAPVLPCSNFENFVAAQRFQATMSSPCEAVSRQTSKVTAP